MIKNIFKIIPETFRNRLQLLRMYYRDYKRFYKSSYEFNKNNYSYENLRAKITFHYHSIEKGLSNERFRPKFGKKAFEQLLNALVTYVDSGFPTEDSRFQQALSTIDSYIKYHIKHGYEVEEVELKFKDLLKYLNENSFDIGGATLEQTINNKDYSMMDFKELANNRHSIRDFGHQKIEEESIFEALQISRKSPSACNRQSYKVHLIKNPEVLKAVFNLQGGLTTHGVNLQYLVLITADNQYMNGPHERNATFIDGGLFLMSFIYALTYKNIASCIMNTNFYPGKENKIRKLIGVKDTEDLIALVALGSFPEKMKYAKSPRDDWQEFTSIV